MFTLNKKVENQQKKKKKHEELEHALHSSYCERLLRESELCTEERERCIQRETSHDCSAVQFGFWVNIYS